MDEVLVIGGSGFVGSHTADALSEKGHIVTIFDKKESPWIKENQNFFQGDMMSQDDLNKAMENKKYVFHFGGIADIDEADERPLDTVESNVIGTMKILLAARKSNISRFFYGSTVYVFSPYGSMYRASKQASETIIETYSQQYGLDYTFLRYGSLYGPRAQKWNGLRNRVEEIIRTKKLIYNGTGEEEREYIYVKDAAKMSVKALSNEYINQAITLTGAQTISSKELIEMIFEIANIELNVEFKDDGSKENNRYIKTPYRYTPKQSKKLLPTEYVDFGQGLLEVIEEAYENKKVI